MIVQLFLHLHLHEECLFELGLPISVQVGGDVDGGVSQWDLLCAALTDDSRLYIIIRNVHERRPGIPKQLRGFPAALAVVRLWLARPGFPPAAQIAYHWWEK